MNEKFNRFRDFLKEMFQLEQAKELDFGIYRIINIKRNEIEKFLDKDLLPQVKDYFDKLIGKDSDKIKEELESCKEELIRNEIEPETNKRYIRLQEKLKNSADKFSYENDVYSSLLNFFKRYYDKGDFISQRRYKNGVYAIPYNGEEVKLHWANADQYYIKTTENFRDYRFKLSDGSVVHFKLKEADTEKDNVKETKGKERKFVLAEEDFISIENGELIINFEYKTYDKDNQKKLNESAINRIFESLLKLKDANEKYEIFRSELSALKPTEKNKKRTLLEKHLNDYTAKNSFDYFIHKDLEGFLKRELDFFIKNEIMHLDDIDTDNEKAVSEYLSKVKVIKRIGHKIIEFLSQIENFQKRLWEKKKFVVDTNWCITLDRIPEKYYKDIAKNREQVEEWVKLFAIDELQEKNLDVNKDFLLENRYLVLDTNFFEECFKEKLIADISSDTNLDENTNGLLINSENFQALNLLQNCCKEKVKCCYIDPPYNAKSSEILYKNSYKHSSWLSLIENRIRMALNLLFDKSIFISAIDEVEVEKLGLLMDSLLTKYNGKTCVSVIINPSGQQGKNFSTTHENLYFYYNDIKDMLAKEVRDKSNADIRNFMNGAKGESGNYRRETGKNCFFPIYIKDKEIIGFGDVCDDNFHPESSNVKIDDSIIAIYPIDSDNVERKWLFERGTVETIKNELSVKFNKNRKEFDIIRTKCLINFKTVWTKTKYSAKEYGTNLLTKMFSKSNFSFPKSLYAVKDCLYTSVYFEKDCLILDFFAGSGTTGHAVIELNREDGGNRKYILVEMGQYFYTVTKPRIQKVIYSKDWKNGKPVLRDGISHMFKYFTMESYEDSLNNIVFDDNISTNSKSFDNNFNEKYIISYMLDSESKNSPCMLNLDMFKNPFNYRMNIIDNDETREKRIDLIETFNYLIGLYVDTMYSKETFRIDETNDPDFPDDVKIIPDKEGQYIFRAIEGELRTGEKTLIIWRNITDDIVKCNSALNAYFKKKRYDTRDPEFMYIFINGDNNLQNMKKDENSWKVLLLEEEFKKRMFEEVEG